jgi:hypothetical protein
LRQAPWDSRKATFFATEPLRSLSLYNILSDERTGLSFTIAAGPRHRSYSRVRVPWDFRIYFIVSDLRLLFSSPPATRRATVEVFNPASTWQGTDLVENTAPHCCSSIVSVGTCLFAKPLFSHGCRVFYSAFVA